MQRLFSTDTLHPRDRFDFWHDVACKNVVGHDSHPQSRQNFRASFERGSLAELSILRFETSPMQVAGTERHVARAEADELFFNRLLEGQISFEQSGREVSLKAGEMMLLDPLLPYIGRFGTGARLLMVKIPRRLLEARTGKLQAMTAVAIKSDHAERGLTSSFLATLPDYVGQLGSAAHGVLREQTLDLIALCLAKTVDERPRLSGGHSLILLTIRAAVEARLPDANLDVKTVAEAAGVSVRYANALLAQENTSLRRLIQTRRLMRCQKALEDPSQSRRTLSEIAYSWGFSDMTHFGRVFRKAHGMLPREYRRLFAGDKSSTSPEPSGAADS
jgi:AraC family transcriptional regulator, positive regulator of tynA and feaB